jgi:hypothetical protein
VLTSRSPSCYHEAVNPKKIFRRYAVPATAGTLLILGVGLLPLTQATSLTTNNLRRIINEGAYWFVANQKPAGDFVYEYDFVQGKETSQNNIVRQVGGLYGLAQTYRRFPEPKFLDTTTNAILYFQSISSAQEIDGRTIRFIEEPGQSIKNNASALFVLSLSELILTNQILRGTFEKQAREYGNFLVSSQRPDGLFWYSYDPVTKTFLEESDYNNGESFFALARMALITQDPVYLDAARRAFDGTRNRYGVVPNTQAYHWFALAFEDWYEVSKDPAVVALLGEQTDRVLKWPSMVALEDYFEKGEPSRYNYGYIGEGVAAAARLMAKTGDERAQKYKDALRNIADFIIKNRRVDNLSGAFCADASCETVRIDMQHHNLSAILYFWELSRE